ncbi:MAG: Mrp/NBP35 family ATP-binding protein [Ruthenibacterium sp.]
MSETCNHDCGSCGESCDSRKDPTDFHEEPHALSSIKRVIGVVSGKGGVGKSMTSAMLAVLLNRRGYHTAVLDADITGPSIPKLFGIHGHAHADDVGCYPIVSKTGIDVMSVNLLLENENDPVVWRGPILAGTVKQFWQEVIWKDVDFMFVDLPPGTGDVPLTVFQTLPLDGILVVTSPQELVGLIVEKAVKMANMMNIPILGIVENMSYAVCPDCGKKLYVFGESHVEDTAKEYGLSVLAHMPIDPQLAKNADQGVIELFEGDYMDKAADAVELLGSKGEAGV